MRLKESEGWIEIRWRRGRRRTQLSDFLKETRGWLKLREEALDHSLWRIRPSVRAYQRGFHWIDFLEIWYWGLLWKSLEKIHISLKLSKTIGHILLRATLDWRKNAIFEWNGILLLRQPRMYKGHANVPHCHVICRPLHLPVLFKTGSRNTHVSTICIQIATSVNTLRAGDADLRF